MAFVTQADLEARIGTLTATQAARAAGLIADAEAAIVDYTGQQIEQVLGDTSTIRHWGPPLWLPQTPVTDVSQVEAIGCPGTPTRIMDTDEWCWDLLDQIDVVNGASPINTYRVTYDHGYPAGQIPAVIVAVTCSMVNRVLTSPTLADGLTGENIGQYGYQLAQQSGSSGSSVRLLRSDKEQLRNFRRSARTINTPIG